MVDDGSPDACCGDRRERGRGGSAVHAGAPGERGASGPRATRAWRGRAASCSCSSTPTTGSRRGVAHLVRLARPHGVGLRDGQHPPLRLPRQWPAAFLKRTFSRPRRRTHVTRFRWLLRTGWRRTSSGAARSGTSTRSRSRSASSRGHPGRVPAHFMARAVDVLPEAVYLYREREDGSRSITDRRAELPVLLDRLRAVETVSAWLGEHAPPGRRGFTRSPSSRRTSATTSTCSTRRTRSTAGLPRPRERVPRRRRTGGRGPPPGDPAAQVAPRPPPAHAGAARGRRLPQGAPGRRAEGADRLAGVRRLPVPRRSAPGHPALRLPPRHRPAPAAARPRAAPVPCVLSAPGHAPP